VIQTISGRFHPYTLDELEALPAPTWLVEGVLGAESLAVLYGASGVGKTFAALDLALSQSTGLDWHGHAVGKPVPVVYIAGEGQTAILRRARAWERYHQRKAGSFLIVREAVPLLEECAVRAFIDDVGVKGPKLVVVDTLARCFGAGDENATKDMNTFVHHIDMIRGKLGCTVLVVHHSGHGQERERGSSALRGAADTMLRLTTRGGQRRQLTCDKQKDGADTLELALVLHVVAEPDPQESSCVLVDDAGGGTTGLSTTATQLLQAFPQTTTATTAAWQTAVSVPDRTFYHAVKGLKQGGFVEQPAAGEYRLTAKGQALRAPVPAAAGADGATAATAPPLKGEQCSSRRLPEGD